MVGSNVLTIDSVINCPHPSGKLVFTGVKHKLTVKGKSVLLKSDIEKATVAGCTNPTTPNPPSQMCAKVSSVTGGEATKLTVGSVAVMLKGKTTGYTNGYPPPPPPPPPPPTGGNMIIGTVQDKLTAV